MTVDAFVNRHGTTRSKRRENALLSLAHVAEVQPSVTHDLGAEYACWGL